MFKRNKNKQANESRLVVTNNSKSTISEQFRTLRTNLQFSSIDSELKTFCVASAAPASGKSLVAANLAATYAIEGQKVLLVDTDLRKPTVHKSFNLPNFKGITTLLSEKNTIPEVIQYTDVENLSIITSGPIPPNPSELLRSQKMTQIIEHFKMTFDIIIFDTPPILAVTDTQIISTKTDGVLFVVPKGDVKKEEVRKSAELLENVNAKVLGFIFNKVEKSEEEYYYYYGE